MHLCQGTRFLLKYEDNRTGEQQEASLTWHGMRTQAEFTIPSPGDKGLEPSAEDPDR